MCVYGKEGATERRLLPVELEKEIGAAEVPEGVEVTGTEEEATEEMRKRRKGGRKRKRDEAPSPWRCQRQGCLMPSQSHGRQRWGKAGD